MPNRLGLNLNPNLTLTLILAASWVCLAPCSAGAEWEIDGQGTLFAVVTHKEGLAAGLAHEHFIVAEDYRATMQADAELTAEGTADWFDFEVEADRLLVDDPEQAAAWQDRLLERELINEPFSELSERDRNKIRKSMLSKKQLDAETHPAIRAVLRDVGSVEGGGYQGRLELTVRGTTVSRGVHFEVERQAEKTTARTEVVAPFEFTDFGIEPYSAMLGAIRVANVFHVFVVLSAAPALGAPPATPSSGGAPSVED